MAVRGALRHGGHRIHRRGVDEKQAFSGNAVLQKRCRDVIAEFVADRSLYPLESRWFAGRSGRVHNIDEGLGPPIVFFHGNSTWRFLYRNVITRLRGQFRCMAMDYLGFGLSEHPDDFGYTVEEQAAAVGELIDYLGLNDQTRLIRLGDEGFRDSAGIYVESVARHLPDNVVVRLPEASHFIQEDAPDAIAEAILKRFQC
jgi:pimeloyl-ACP methyl ester carboxylesterase